MGKRKRAARAELAAPAERHGFTAGLLGHDVGEYHVNVSEQVALAVDVVYACVRTIADAISDAAVSEFRGTDQIDPPHRLIRRPAISWTRRRWLWRIAATCALYNICYLERVGDDGSGVALSLVPLRPGQLSRVGDTILIDGRREVSADRIRVVRRADWPSVTEDLGTVLQLARQSFAAAWALDAYRTDFWEQGGAPQIVLTTDQPLTSGEADDAGDRWTEKRRNSPGRPAVMGKGIKAEPLGADLASSDGGTAGDRMGQSIARYFGMPAWIVNVASASGSMVYSNTETAGLDLVRYTLRGYIGPIEDELSDELPGDYLTGRRAVIDVSALTMGTALERAQAYQIATGDRPWMRPSEVRAREHMPVDATIDASTLPTTGSPAPVLEGV